MNDAMIQQIGQAAFPDRQEPITAAMDAREWKRPRPVLIFSVAMVDNGASG
jgi:hypothetical protein